MSVHAQANGDDGKGQNSDGQTAAEKQEARILVLEEKLGNFARLVERLEARIRQQESQPERPASTAPVVEVDRPLSVYNGVIDLYASPFTSWVESLGDRFKKKSASGCVKHSRPAGTSRRTGRSWPARPDRSVWVKGKAWGRRAEMARRGRPDLKVREVNPA